MPSYGVMSAVSAVFALVMLVISISLPSVKGLSVVEVEATLLIQHIVYGIVTLIGMLATLVLAFAAMTTDQSK